MRQATVVSAVLLAITAGLCHADGVPSVVRRLGQEGEDNRAVLDLLMQDPSSAARALIAELAPISLEELRPEQVATHWEANHVVWCLRALRYITNGKRVLSRAVKVEPSPSKEPRWQLLLDAGDMDGRIPFFAVWMSRDVVYFAPVSAQTDVIEAWREWWDREGTSFPYQRAASIDDWYF